MNRLTHIADTVGTLRGSATGRRAEVSGRIITIVTSRAIRARATSPRRIITMVATAARAWASNIISSEEKIIPVPVDPGPLAVSVCEDISEAIPAEWSWTPMFIAGEPGSELGTTRYEKKKWKSAWLSNTAVEVRHSERCRPPKTVHSMVANMSEPKSPRSEGAVPPVIVCDVAAKTTVKIALTKPRTTRCCLLTWVGFTLSMISHRGG